jgi:site-specific recombinase XerD
VVDFLTHAKRGGASGATIARKLSVVRSFFLYLKEDGRILAVRFAASRHHRKSQHSLGS